MHQTTLGFIGVRTTGENTVLPTNNDYFKAGACEGNGAGATRSDITWKTGETMANLEGTKQPGSNMEMDGGGCAKVVISRSVQYVVVEVDRNGHGMSPWDAESYIGPVMHSNYEDWQHYSDLSMSRGGCYEAGQGE